MLGGWGLWAAGSTDRPLVGTLLHQTEELLGGAVVAVLLVQLLHGGQQLVDDGLELGAANRLPGRTARRSEVTLRDPALLAAMRCVHGLPECAAAAAL